MFSTKGITDEMVRLVGKGVGVRSGELAVMKSSSISRRVGNGLFFRRGSSAGLRRRGILLFVEYLRRRPASLSQLSSKKGIFCGGVGSLHLDKWRG